MQNNLITKIDILESYQIKKRLIPFVGSGFTMNIDGFPNWDTFVKKLSEKLKLPDDRRMQFNMLANNLEKTEFFVRERGKSIKGFNNISNYGQYEEVYKAGRDELRDVIKEMFNDKIHPEISYDPIKWEVHRLLVNKFSKMIYTTNWDSTLEAPELRKENLYAREKYSKENFDCLDENKKYSVNPKPNYAFTKQNENEGKPRIIKFHGDTTHDGKEFIVSCLKEYHERMTNETCLEIKLKSDLLRYDFLLLGYSLRDPNFQLMIHQLSKIILDTYKKVGNKLNPKLYFVTLDRMDDLRVNLLKDTFPTLEPYFLLENDDYLDENGKKPKKDVVREKTIELLKEL